MMTWRYGILKEYCPITEEYSFSVCEVYDLGVPDKGTDLGGTKPEKGFTGAVTVIADTPSELLEVLDMMRGDIEKALEANETHVETLTNEVKKDVSTDT